MYVYIFKQIDMCMHVYIHMYAQQQNIKLMFKKIKQIKRKTLSIQSVIIYNNKIVTINN
jgi:hypothetical protein